MSWKRTKQIVTSHYIQRKGLEIGVRSELAKRKLGGLC